MDALAQSNRYLNELASNATQYGSNLMHLVSDSTAFGAALREFELARIVSESETCVPGLFRYRSKAFRYRNDAFRYPSETFRHRTEQLRGRSNPPTIDSRFPRIHCVLGQCKTTQSEIIPSRIDIDPGRPRVSTSRIDIDPEARKPRARCPRVSCKPITIQPNKERKNL
jgi:hypothetical protein